MAVKSKTTLALAICKLQDCLLLLPHLKTVELARYSLITQAGNRPYPTGCKPSILLKHTV